MANETGGRHVKWDTATVSFTGERYINKIAIVVSAATGAVTLVEGAINWFVMSGMAVGLYEINFSTPQRVDALSATTITNAAVYIYFA